MHHGPSRRQRVRSVSAKRRRIALAPAQRQHRRDAPQKNIAFLYRQRASGAHDGLKLVVGQREGHTTEDKRVPTSGQMMHSP